MVARLFRPAKTAMQSGMAKSKNWVVEYEPESGRQIDPLMGWTSSSDMKSQIKLTFLSKEDAVIYLKRNGIPYQVYETCVRKQKPKSYSDNFKFGRIGSWTH